MVLLIVNNIIIFSWRGGVISTVQYVWLINRALPLVYSLLLASYQEHSIYIYLFSLACMSHFFCVCLCDRISISPDLQHCLRHCMYPKRYSKLCVSFYNHGKTISPPQSDQTQLDVMIFIYYRCPWKFGGKNSEGVLTYPTPLPPGSRGAFSSSENSWSLPSPRIMASSGGGILGENYIEI